MSASKPSSALAEIYRQLSPRRRRQLYLLLALMVGGAFSELLAIGAVLPFLSLLTDPGRIEQIGGAVRAMDWLGATSQRDQLIVVTILFAAATLLAGAVRLLLAWAGQAFAFGVGHDFSMDVQRRLLYQPYSFHVSKNSSELVAAQEKIQSLVFTVVLPLMLGITAAIISLFILAILVYIDPVVAGIAGGAFSLIYVAVSYSTRKRLNRNSSIVNSSYALRVQAVQESLGGIRDILIDRSQPVYMAQFSEIDLRFRRAQIATGFISSAPRFVVEAAGMILIAVLALLLSGRSGGLTGSLPVLGALALSAQRLLPLLQQIYYGWAQIRGNWALVADLLELLKLKMPPAGQGEESLPDLPFHKEIRFSDVAFSYPGRSEPALADVNLVIPKGASVALIGKTGSGKSTLVDLLMGLLDPVGGSITIDGVPPVGPARLAWQAQIAHVPQSIYLADTTIERNIAFGAAEEDVDAERVRTAARQAQLHDFIEELPEGYETRVGERGVRLSGGQRQRLGLARALYKNARVLILDEATSALDKDTEAAVMRALRGIDEAPTVVMIAHRLTTIADCDKVVRLDGGRIVQVGSYSEVVGTSGLEKV